jgi:hypothetical protein
MLGNAVSDNGVKCIDNTMSVVTTLTEYIVEISVMQIGKIHKTKSNFDAIVHPTFWVKNKLG